MEEPWNNCVAVGVDNTNANIGKKNSIKSRLAVVNNSIYIQGCPCHNTAKAGWLLSSQQKGNIKSGNMLKEGVTPLES